MPMSERRYGPLERVPTPCRHDPDADADADAEH
jgi:hypothetical protein